MDTRKIKIRDIRSSYLNKRENKIFVATILGDFEDKENYQYKTEKLRWWKKHKEDEIELPKRKDLLKLLSKVNLEIKREEVENRYKNKFYKFKKKYLKHLFENEKIDKIIDSGDLWKFVIGDFSFHQPKVYYKNYDIKPQESEEYIKPDMNSLPEFDIQDFKKCMILIITEL